MIHVRSWLFLLTLVVPSLAAAEPRVFIAAAVDGKDPAPGPILARAGQTVSLYAVVVEGKGTRSRFVTDAPALTVGKRRVSGARISRPDPAWTFAWSQVEPHPHHVALPPPNPGNPAYSNAILFGPQHGRWLGYDTIEYHETVVPNATASRLEVTRATPTNPNVNVHDGLGTMRFKVTVKGPGFTASSPGADDREGHGISRQVMRIGFRQGDDLPGWLTTFFNVPNVFGSGGSHVQHQTDLFQGADCADVIVGALRVAGVPLPYSSVTGLLSHARPVTPRLFMNAGGVFAYADGHPGDPVRLAFGIDVRPGDLMLIDYVGPAASPRTWDHVAVVATDAGKAGEFDPEDRVMHMGYLYGLADEPAKSQAPAIVQFLRWNPGIQAKLAPGTKR
jgi:hypothetical protein